MDQIDLQNININIYDWIQNSWRIAGYNEETSMRFGSSIDEFNHIIIKDEYKKVSQGIWRKNDKQLLRVSKTPDQK